MAPEIGTTGKMVTAFGETKNIRAWVEDERCVISQPSLSERLNNGWEPEKAIVTPPTKKNRAADLRIKVGDNFNRLTLEEQWLENRYGQNVMIGRFLCDCGNIYEGKVSPVKNGHTKSCGCLLSEKSKERASTLSLTHGQTNHPLYRVYHSMINRCYNDKNISYKNYGLKGIRVCDEWKSDFEQFFHWAIHNGWATGLTIERKNTLGNYEPSNCVIATHKEQANNKTSNHRLTAFGEEKTIAQWAEDVRCIVEYQHLFERVTKLGWDTEKAITTPVRYIDFSNKSKYVGVSYVVYNGKWKAYITINQKRKHIGHYDNEDEAARARDTFVIQHGLTHIKLNFKN